MDFDGLVELAVEVLDAEPAVAARLRARWPRISVDEYQDIDAAQYALLRLLAGDGTGLTVIGDPDQAIYRFRGADVGFFLRFGQDYPGAGTAALSANYRSGPGIVAGAMQAIAPATLVPGRVLRAARHAVPGTKIRFHEAADPAGEAAWIAEAIDRLLGGSSFHSLDSGRADGHGHGGIGLADIAVLYRTDAQAASLGQGLTRAGLPFQKRSHDLLERRPGVAEILRELPLAGLARAGWRRAGDPASRPGRRSRPSCAGVVGRLAAAAEAARTAAGARGGLSGTDLRTAGEVLAPLARRCGDDMERFRTEIALGAEVDALDPRADAIALLTLHAAKGLEFEVVFLAGCERGLLPLWLPGAAPDSPPGSGRGTAAAVRGHDPGPHAPAAELCGAAEQARQQRRDRGLAVPVRDRPGPAGALRAAAGPPSRRPPAPAALAAGRSAGRAGVAAGGRRRRTGGCRVGARPGSGASGSGGRRSSIRLLPSVLGFTRPRSRNSATPSS